MQVLIDIGIIIADFIVGIFSGDEYKNIIKWINKKIKNIDNNIKS